MKRKYITASEGGVWVIRIDLRRLDIGCGGLRDWFCLSRVCGFISLVIDRYEVSWFEGFKAPRLYSIIFAGRSRNERRWTCSGLDLENNCCSTGRFSYMCYLCCLCYLCYAAFERNARFFYLLLYLKALCTYHAKYSFPPNHTRKCDPFFFHPSPSPRAYPIRVCAHRGLSAREKSG